MGRSKLAKAGTSGENHFSLSKDSISFFGNLGLSDSDFGFEASDCRIGDFVGFGFGSDWDFVFGFGFGFRIEPIGSD